MKVEIVINETPYELTVSGEGENFTATGTIPAINLGESETDKDIPVTIRITEGEEVTDITGYSMHISAYFYTITDRTANDVAQARQLQQAILNRTATSAQIEQYKKDSKGALNTSDLIRNWRNVHILAKLLEVEDPTEPPRPEFPSGSYYQALIDAVTQLRTHKLLYSTTPETPSRPLTTYQKWNDLEKILLDYNQLIRSELSSINYCGDMYYCGDMNNTII